MRDTIFAVATASGRAAVAVVRISGPGAERVAEAICGNLPPPRYAGLRRLRAGDDIVDQSLVLWMPGPASFTGEDCVEFHTHGGPAVVGAVTTALLATGARLAEPGEFTRRAFEAGRLDLTQAEAIADLIDAETEAQRRQAQGQFDGALSRQYETWLNQLLDASAMIEAAIDFPEDDIPGGIAGEAGPILRSVEEELRLALGQTRGEQIRSGLRVAIIGAPNVGKSSLINALSGRDAAIVTSIPGTTRDVIEVHLRVRGQVVIIADTAGLRDTDDPIEAEGVNRARRWADEADFRIMVADGGRPETIESAAKLAREGDLLVVNKDDTLGPSSVVGGMIYTSAINNRTDALLAALEIKVEALTAGSDFPMITRQRHRGLLDECLNHVVQGLEGMNRGAELMGENVRLACRCIRRLTGQNDPEAVLDRVFSTFCIGK